MEISGKNVQFDKDGFMLDPELWDEGVAVGIGQEEGITELSEKHWAIINFIRSYWQEHDLAPPVRLICKEVGVGVRDIYKLFTSGPARGACRVAGLPKPDGCV